MNAPALSQLCLIALVGVSVLSARVSGVHLHLCRDGQEPPATMHLADAGNHDEQHAPADSQHSDVDVGLDAGLAKAAKSLTDFPSLAGPVAGPFILAAVHKAVWAPLNPAHSRARPRFLRPPLRGPPL